MPAESHACAAASVIEQATSGDGWLDRLDRSGLRLE
jgi:hypothetical protein